MEREKSFSQYFLEKSEIKIRTERLTRKKADIK